MGAIPQVIVVSPDSDNRNALQSILSRHGCNTKFVSTLRECQEVLSEQDVDLVFCDRILTDGTYRDVLVMRRSGKRVRVVVTSRLADWDQYLEALHDGAFDVIASPCALNDVVWMLKRAQREDQKSEAEGHLKTRHNSVGGSTW